MIALKAKLAGAEEGKKQLKDQLEKLETELEESEKTFPLRVNAVKGPLVSEIAWIKEEKEELEAREKELVAEVDGAKAALMSLEKLSTQYRIELSVARDYLEVKTKEVMELTGKLEKIKKEKGAGESEGKVRREQSSALTDDLNKNIKELRAELKKVESSIPEKVEESKKPLEKKIEQLKNEEKRLKKEIEALEENGII